MKNIMLQQRKTPVLLYYVARSLTGTRWACKTTSFEKTKQIRDAQNKDSRRPVLTMYTKPVVFVYFGEIDNIPFHPECFSWNLGTQRKQKDNCSLCDDANAQLDKHKGLFELNKVDITAPKNKDWFDKYKYDIPVFHFNGQYLMRHKVHEGLLTKTLKDFENKNQI